MKKSSYLSAVVATPKGEVIDLEGYAAVAMSGDSFFLIEQEMCQKLPFGTELMFLPDRTPVAYNLKTRQLEELLCNPYAPGESIFPVAAFNSPGYLLAGTSAYVENKKTQILSLFSYGAVGWFRDHFYSASLLVDPEPRQDLRKMPVQKVKTGIFDLKKKYPQNRLITHLEKCALTYGCPAAKNFFLGRYEAPLPTSKICNARCVGCISLQEGSSVSCCQERIQFTPTPKEIAQVALFHIQRVPDSIVSFGQGCEGEPLMASNVIKPAIEKIRQATPKGTINLNTNGSLPEQLEELLDVGLDSIRVSVNSFQPTAYAAYFRPKGYSFDDVLKSIRHALDRKKYVAINYLNCPGFTDTPEEQEALFAFLKNYSVHLIQWRNLNFDPARYYALMKRCVSMRAPLGVPSLLTQIRKTFPLIRFGYFNPPKERFFTTGT